MIWTPRVFPCPLPTTAAGDFLLTLRQADGALLAVIPYTVAGNSLAQPSALSAESLAKGDLRIKLENSSTPPGETIKMRLSTPFAGAGLITIERENVLPRPGLPLRLAKAYRKSAFPTTFRGAATSMCPTPVRWIPTLST